ncbi:hypothetical protein GCM10009069_28730 [Algimonas arctica]|uniref:Bacterial Ig-like domain-containing protein n=1 Tax=Algimonas arctica TaxID=1479486 RepID=A0A8J3G3G7_9PROT|nr:hypothetical protein [Algimonas arctica]GHB04406.1 hypothetical protein GCM10009069_28730 [Algimonas arctica]
MKQTRVLGMIIGGLVLALILFAGVSLSGRWGVSTGGGSEAVAPIAASLTPVTFTRVSEITVDGRAVLQLSGLAEPSSVIALLDRGDRLLQVRATPQGVWSARLNVTGPGMAVEAILFDTPPSDAQSDTSQITSDEDLEAMTSIRGVETIFRIHRATDGDGTESALIMISTPGAPTRLVQSPFNGLPSNGPLAMGAIDYDDKGGVIFSGVSEVEGRVRLYVANAAIGETRVGADGRWTYIASSVMPLGEYEVRAELLDGVGNPVVSVPFERLPPLPPSGSDDGSLSVSFSSYRWQIRRSLVGGGTQSTVIFAPE